MRRHALLGLAGLALAMGLAGCKDSERPGAELQPGRAQEEARIVPVEEALAGAHLPTLDPATMSDAEIRKALPSEAHCDFHYTSTGKPVLALEPLSGGGAAHGVVKLNGNLVLLEPAADQQSGAPAGEVRLAAGEVRTTITSLGEDAGGSRREARMVFEVGDALRVGYLGYYGCTG
jgi:hypothetical protein